MLIGRFLGNRDGGVAPMLAIAALPLLGFVGAAVDYSRAASARTAMQAVLDATALMLSRDAQGMPTEQLNQRSIDFFKTQYLRPEVYSIQLTPQFSVPYEGNFSLKVTASATIDTVFMRIFGHDNISFSASSEVLWGVKKLNLALVLDNTGSMAASSKMTNLKIAAHNLLTTLKNAVKSPGDIKVAIVPFATDVNVGAGYVNAPWIDWTDWEAANTFCSVPISNPKTKTKCTTAGGTWNAHSNWNGCVYDRDQNSDVANTVPLSGSPATLFRAHQASACSASMMPLSEDWTALNAKIDDMTPTGNTNVTIGMAWGYQLLSPVEPFNAPAPAPDLDKVIVMLTDGTNTQNRWTSSSTAIDARTQKVCDNIKAANIKVYTVRVINGNASLLQGCASKVTMYYDVQDANQLNNVFSSIAQNLANLRIAK
jgi:Flp pilus assembly protein TadG